MADGWSYGPERCDATCRHPVPRLIRTYLKSEKVYDRNAVLATVRTILALGFVIERRSEVAGPNKALSRRRFAARLNAHTLGSSPDFR